MNLDRVNTDDQISGHLPIGDARGHQLEDFSLAIGQTFPAFSHSYSQLGSELFHSQHRFAAFDGMIIARRY
jgi:hypothetical protein